MNNFWKKQRCYLSSCFQVTTSVVSRHIWTMQYHHVAEQSSEICWNLEILEIFLPVLPTLVNLEMLSLLLQAFPWTYFAMYLFPWIRFWNVYYEHFYWNTDDKAFLLIFYMDLFFLLDISGFQKTFWQIR